MATPPDFTAGSVLTAAQMNAVGLWRVTTCTVSSVGGTAATASNGVVTIGTNNTSVTVSNAFSADYDNYRIIISGGVGSTSLAIGMTLGGSGTGYYGILNYATYAVGTIAGAAINNGASWLYAGVATVNNINALIELNSPFAAKTTGISSAYTENSTTGASGSFNGFHNVATSYTAFTLTAGAGNFSGGKIRVYGYRN